MWRKRLNDFVETIDTGVDNVLCLKIKKDLLNTELDVMFITVYIHPANSVYYQGKEYDCTYEPLEEFIDKMIDDHGDMAICVLGDTNSRVSDWSRH